MTDAPNTLPTDPPPGVPLDQTKAQVDSSGGEIGIGFVWLWRKLRTRVLSRSRSGNS